jgi:hypothetical protein
LHELAHLRRWDDWTNVIQRILRSLFFFQPAVWWIGESLSLERELACDDFVLASTADPRAYAQCLVSVAEKSFLRHSLTLAQAAVSRAKQTALRVARILNVDKADRRGTSPAWTPALALIAALSVVGVIALPQASSFVAFDNEPSNTATTLALAKTSQSGSDFPHIGARLIPSAAHRDLNAGAFNNNIRVRRKLARAVPSDPRGDRNNSGNKNDNDQDSVAVNSPSPKLVRLHADSVRPEGESVGGDAPGYADHRPTQALFVVQTQQFDRSGDLVLSIYVWRLTVFHPVNPQVQRGITAKTT